MKLYFDESGQSGTHLFDREQPHFTIGSTNVDDGEALRILDRCFPDRRGAEIKSQAVFKTAKGRRGLLEFARVVGSFPERFCTARIDKRFAIVSKMVDFLVEPVFRSRGYNFYAGDYARRFANTSCLVFERVLDGPDAESLMALYNEFARRPGPATLAALKTALDGLEGRVPGFGGAVIELMAEGVRRFVELHGTDGFVDSNDVHVTSVIRCMAHWQAQHPGPFDIVHDESNHFFQRSERWAMLTDPAIEHQVLSLGDRTLTLPIPVSSTVAGRSHEHPSLQLCDFVAGFFRWEAAPTRTEDDRTFARDVVTAGMGQVSIFPIEPGHEVVEGPPERSDGPDFVDRIMAAVNPR